MEGKGDRGIKFTANCALRSYKVYSKAECGILKPVFPFQNPIRKYRTQAWKSQAWNIRQRA